MSEFWHFMTHLFRLQLTRLIHKDYRGHEWLWTECVTCGVSVPLDHSQVCWCKEARRVAGKGGK